jgi:diguanylate cyclase (GGDEF)-like protein
MKPTVVRALRGGVGKESGSSLKVIRQYLRVPRLESIRSRILVLAVGGALIPAGIALGVAYSQNRRALQSHLTQDLLSAGNQSARAMGVWLKERTYDLRVFASSDEVLNNLNRYAIGQGSIPSARLREYLRSLHERFTDFEQIMVLDGQGRLLATSARQTRPLTLPTGWEKTFRRDNQLVGDAYWDAKEGKGKLMIAVPVQRSDGRLIGSLAAELNLAPMQSVLKSFARDTITGGAYLVSESGALLAGTAGITPRLLSTRLERRTHDRLKKGEGQSLTYTNHAGTAVLGTYKRVPQVQWAVLSELSQSTAFEQVRHFRNIALAAVALVLLVVGATAYRLGLLIVRPLERLAEGAAEVSTGDLSVDLPSTGGGDGEVGVLTRVFNHMVKRLREGRQQLADTNETLRVKNEALERLSVTDGLTGLSNHRSLMQRLGEEGIRSKRTKKPFSVIMADVDYFKAYNDDYGHPAGDEVLKKMSAILREATRTMDSVSRYGGEEFAILLPETSLSGAREVAERIRARVESTAFPNRAITLSIGVAEFPKHADSPKSVLKAADVALYHAKRGGRNQVAQPRASAKETLPAARRAAKRRA